MQGSLFFCIWRMRIPPAFHATVRWHHRWKYERSWREGGRGLDFEVFTNYLEELGNAFFASFSWHFFQDPSLYYFLGTFRFHYMFFHFSTFSPNPLILIFWTWHCQIFAILLYSLHLLQFSAAIYPNGVLSARFGRGGGGARRVHSAQICQARSFFWLPEGLNPTNPANNRAPCSFIGLCLGASKGAQLFAHCP